MCRFCTCSGGDFGARDPHEAAGPLTPSSPAVMFVKQQHAFSALPLQFHHVFACAIGGHLRGTGARTQERQAGFFNPELQSF